MRNQFVRFHQVIHKEMSIDRTSTFKMYNVGFRAFVTSHLKCIRLVSVRSSLPISMRIRSIATTP